MIPHISRIPPTLAPPSTRALAGGLASLVRPPRHPETVQRELASLYPGSAIHGYATGRAALTAALRLAMAVTGRATVVLPAYTSFSVAAAAAAARARVLLCDIEPGSLDLDPYDLRECVDEGTAAIVLPNLYGYPSSIQTLAWARREGVLIIDDAAQALGATARGEPVGSRGDLGILSFGRGKPVTTGRGGILLVNSRDLDAALERTSKPAPGSPGLGAWLTAFTVRLAASPLVFGLVSRLPGARIGESVYDPSIAMATLPAAVHGLAVDLSGAVRRQLEIRTRIAGLWMDALRGSESVRLLTPRSDTQPTFLRVAVFARDRAMREELVRRLARAGFPFVRSYPVGLRWIREFRSRWCEDRPTPGADRVADTLLALPCHERVTAASVERGAAVFDRPPARALGEVVAPGALTVRNR